MVAQTNHRQTIVQRKINLTRVICFQMGKTYTAKTPPDDFRVTTPKNSLLSQQVVTSKGISVEPLPQYPSELVL